MIQVQAAGAELFSGLQRAVGSRIMDEILQFLLDEVSEGSDEAVRGDPSLFLVFLHPWAVLIRLSVVWLHGRLQLWRSF